MFSENSDKLSGLNYQYELFIKEWVDICVHDNQICMTEDTLSKLLGISIDNLVSTTKKEISKGKINISNHLRYYAWYGSSGGKIYKLLTENIDLYNDNTTDTLEDDKLKIVFSNEAIETLMDQLNYPNKKTL